MSDPGHRQPPRGDPGRGQERRVIPGRCAFEGRPCAVRGFVPALWEAGRGGFSTDSGKGPGGSCARPPGSSSGGHPWLRPAVRRVSPEEGLPHSLGRPGRRVLGLDATKPRNFAVHGGTSHTPPSRPRQAAPPNLVNGNLVIHNRVWQTSARGNVAGTYASVINQRICKRGMQHLIIIALGEPAPWRRHLNRSEPALTLPCCLVLNATHSKGCELF